MKLIDFDYWMSEVNELVDMAHDLTVKYGGEHDSDCRRSENQASGE